MNKFGGFVHTSPLCSSDPTVNPLLHLASNAIRDYFGPTVQTVADCLLSEAGCCSAPNGGGGVNSADGFTLISILQKVKKYCSRDINETRVRLTKLVPGRMKISKARGPESSGFVVSDDAIAEALLTMLQHSIVTVIPVEAPPGRPSTTPSCGSNTATKQQRPQLLYKYKIDASRARLLIRYPRFIEYTKRSHDETAAAIIQELLVHGRMTVQDIVMETEHTLQASLTPSTADVKEEGPSSAPPTTAVKDEKTTDTKPATTGDTTLTSDASSTIKKETYERYVTILDALKNLVEGGYVEMVKPLQHLNYTHEIHTKKSEGFDVGAKSGQKRKLNEFLPKEGNQNEIDVVENILKSGNYQQSHFPPGSVWRVNVHMFHAVLRAFAFGRLVAERFGNKIDSAGSIISAALKFTAYQRYSPISPTAAMDETRRLETIGMFCAEDILHFLPSPVLHTFKNKPGGATANLSRVLIQLAQQSHPKVVNEVESSHGHAQGGIFEISVRQILMHLQRRTLHQFITDAHGEIASRIYSILEAKGYLEAESVADAAMVPVKEAREVLYELFQAKLIILVNLQQGKQHNAATSIYLWGVDCWKTTQSVSGYVALALHNIRLRRLHEMEVGKDWVERAKEPSVDENEHDLDKLNYNMFCQGLERLDTAALQLDETLMVMKDFSMP